MQFMDRSVLKGMDQDTERLKEITKQAGLPKVLGTACYISDIYPDKALVGAVVRSPLPHCEIRRIDTTEAKSIPGVRAVLTSEDVPGLNVIPKSFLDQPVLAHDKARSKLDAIALIAAENSEAAQVAAQAVIVEYKHLPAIHTIEEALLPNAPKIHKDGNVLVKYHLSRGDVEKGFREADIVVENSYHTPAVEHAYLEPDAGAAEPTPDGGIRIWFGCNSVYVERDIVASVLDLPIEKIEVIQTYVGGVFGGRNAGLIPSYLGLLVYHTGRPVRLSYSRREMFVATTKRHPQWIRVRTGAKRDGQITAASYQIISDTGPYAHWGASILLFSSIGAPGPYRIPNLEVETQVVYTNNVTMGAMRSWGMPAVTFATESQMDSIAAELDIHPIILRWINAADEGDEIITGQKLPEGVGLKATIAAAAKDMGVSLPE